MRAKGSILAWVSAGAALAIAGCVPSDPCARLDHNIERVRSGELSAAVSERISTRMQTRRVTGRRERVKVLLAGDFTPMDHERLHQCLGPTWRGAVEMSLREDWEAPAIVYAREGWPNVVLLDDGRKLEIRIENEPSD